MEYNNPGSYIPIIYLLYSRVPGLGFPVESLYCQCQSGFQGRESPPRVDIAVARFGEIIIWRLIRSYFVPISKDSSLTRDMLGFDVCLQECNSANCSPWASAVVRYALPRSKHQPYVG